MQILDHAIVGAPFPRAHAMGGALAEPSLIILHDTAGRLTKGSSVDWFTSTECGTSAHVVVERDGSVTQIVPFNRIAFHAGKSVYSGKSVRGSCNAFSIGIEIVNPGMLDKDGRAWFHKKTEPGFTGTEKKATKEHGAGFWMGYTPEQVDTVTNLCMAIVAAYPSITDISTHWAISPGRKVDINPLFPLEHVRQAAFEHLLEPMAPTPMGEPVGSRIVATSRAGEVVTASGAVGGVGLSLAEALGYGEKILPLIKTYGLQAFILIMLALAAGFAMVKHFRREDHIEGRTQQ